MKLLLIGCLAFGLLGALGATSETPNSTETCSMAKSDCSEQASQEQLLLQLPNSKEKLAVLSKARASNNGESEDEDASHRDPWSDFERLTRHDPEDYEEEEESGGTFGSIFGSSIDEVDDELAKLVISVPGDGSLKVINAAGQGLKGWVSGVTPCAAVEQSLGYYVRETAGFLSSPRGVAVDMKAGKVFWADALGGYHDPFFFNASIFSAPLDGSAITPVVTSSLKKEPEGKTSPSPWPVNKLYTPIGLGLDTENSKVYWADFSPSARKIQRANYDGTEVEDVLTDLQAPLGLAVDSANSMLYFTDAYAVNSYSLDGGSITRLKDVRGFPVGIALDVPRNHVYYTEPFSLDRGILRMDLDGSNHQSILKSRLDPDKLIQKARAASLYVDFEGGFIYWSDARGDAIMQCTITGAGSKVLLRMPGSYLAPGTPWGITKLVDGTFPTVPRIPPTTAPTAPPPVPTSPPVPEGPFVEFAQGKYCQNKHSKKSQFYSCHRKKLTGNAGPCSGKESCEAKCASKKACKFYLWKDDETRAKRYECMLFKGCAKTVTYRGGKATIYKKVSG